MPEKTTDLDAFRYGAEGVIEIVKKLKPFCTNFDELIGMLEAGLGNEALLKLLLKETTGKK